MFQSRQSFCGIPDFALAGQEHQDVPRWFCCEFVDCVGDRLDLIACFGADDFVVGVVGIAGIVRGAGPHGHLPRPVADLHRIGPSGYLNNGRSGEMRCEALRFDGRRCDDHLQLRTAGQQLAQVSQQKVDVETAFVGFIEDERVVLQQAAVALDLGEQDAVGHQFDQGAVADLVGEPDRVADYVAERAVQLVGDALRDSPGGQPTGLRVPDGAAHAPPDVEADLGQLGRLAGAGFSGDDHHLMREYRSGDVLAPIGDREVGIADRRHGGLAGRHQ